MLFTCIIHCIDDIMNTVCALEICIAGKYLFCKQQGFYFIYNIYKQNNDCVFIQLTWTETRMQTILLITPYICLMSPNCITWDAEWHCKCQTHFQCFEIFNLIIYNYLPGCVNVNITCQSDLKWWALKIECREDLRYLLRQQCAQLVSFL